MNNSQKIKQLRKVNELTLEELASRCELTKGFLSQVENNITSPSISTLEDILEALGSSLAEFFSEATQDKYVFKKKDFFVDEQENYIIKWIVPNAQKQEMEPILLELNPGCISNIMEPVAESIHPIIKGIRNKMILNGALGAGMSGSGPTVFGIFPDYETAKKSHDSFAHQFKDVFIVSAVS